MADNVPPQTSQDPNTEAQAFPERIRVHALAKLLGVTSKQVVAQLAEMGVDVRSVQSSVVRADAETVASALGGSVVTQNVTPEAEAVVEAEPAPAAARVEPDLFTNIETTEATAPSTAGPASVPVFLQPEAAPEAPKARRRARSPKKVETPAAEARVTEAPVTETPAVETPAAEAPVAETPSPEVPTLEVPADASDEAANDQDTAESAEQESNDQDGQSGPRRRRRGRRGRGRGRGDAQTDDQDDSDDDSDESSTDAVASDQPTDQTSTSDETSTDSEATPDADASESQDDDTEDAAEASPRRSSNRRSRSRRSARSESSATDESTPDDAPESDTSDDADTAESAESDDDESTADSASRRRRRRRRRKSGADGADGDATTEDDPPNTVVHEREPRQRKAKDEVQGITGSTRLEAKRQRRRDGRDAGRRRPPILTESEFLARRESVDRTMVVREKALAGQPDLTQVAVLEDGVLVEHFVTSTASGSIVGNVYLGRVQNVLPSMEAAFIDIGKGRNGVLYAGEVDWDAAGLGGNSRKIEQALKPGDQVLVQVSKDPVGHKGARLTTQISLAGRFLVYVPGGSSTGISRKLPDNERKRLKDILRDIVPAEAGVIIRTASEGVSAEELARDVTRLQAQWAMVSERSTGAESAKGSAPVTLYEEPDLLVKVVRDLFNEDFSKLVIEGDRAWSTVQSYIETVAPDMLSRVERYTSSSKDVDVFAAYRIDEQLAKALDRKVWLPSGGTLVIDRTEAMTVVDVNTGKFTGEGGNLEETVTRNNLEAAEEVVRQMRLRDIGGMIVVDFIDMVLESNRDLVLRRLTEALGRDRTRHQVSEVTSLGLVQMTRKRMGTGLIEAFSTTCEHCHGRGLMMHQFPVEAAKDDGGRGNSRSDNSRSDNNQRSDNSRSDNNQRSEGGSRRRRGGKDRSDSRAQDAVDTGASEDDTTDTTVDPSIRRAHPVALAMAAHLHPDDVADSGSDPIDEAAAAVAAVRDARTAPDESPATDVSSDTAPVDVPDETVVEPDAAAAPATRPRRSRRVSRAASAPAGDSAGTVIVVPSTPVNGSAAAVSEDSAPAVVEDPAAVTVGGGASVAAAAPARRPRRRAAGRPAGPPPGDES
ncbi:ribonuclease E [Rhodococcus sp. Leaf7]|uniref:translation initiation factor IF-2 N-terminal domain-containing protein n=1 Tax=unclassified Rhodococcus (in: high G+C Gram-positive bacteria) TaxID=192944 RepID=UPI0006F9DFDC|nr:MULTISPECIES: translation initiation factor IF-2 N-terminal domain-containing protein [unclassified Rhodococcus (in: high G+C Gram-positive bacteria)]KQU03196.1 ribonuclease E [Rhodococcus sp. Leaf7]KQU38296.1 ribonuclease E [Rhodococcus sp. Leaf247]